MEIAVIGGQLIIDKKVYAKEMMVKNSFLKTLLQLRPSHPASTLNISKDASLVYIDYNGSSGVLLETDYQKFFQDFKSKYGSSVKGRLTIQTNWFNSFISVVDLNTDEVKVIT